MGTYLDRVRDYVSQILSEREPGELETRLNPRFDNPAPGVPRERGISEEGVARRWQLFEDLDGARDQLHDPLTASQLGAYERNIENFVGTVKVPVGLAGPLRMNGLFASGDYYVPLATTEAALVASYNRGAQLISAAGGCAAMVLNEGVTRAPGFAFDNLKHAGVFLAWVATQLDAFTSIAASTTRHGKLVDINMTLEGNHVYLAFQFTVGDASGQNMVTIATDAILDYIEKNSPVRPVRCFVEANMSGDKKASSQSFQSVRGKKVSAEVVLPAGLVEESLHTSVQIMVDYWRMSAMGGVMSGTMGLQGHYANGLAAVYIACGQDAACIAESAVGITRFELTEAGDLYASVTLPNIIVGTVGGGTGLPSQEACLNILGLAGPGHARAFAEVCAGLSLAGELSIIGALAAREFTNAHRSLARER